MYAPGLQDGDLRGYSSVEVWISGVLLGAINFLGAELVLKKCQ